jgi:hypothetical protein
MIDSISRTAWALFAASFSFFLLAPVPPARAEVRVEAQLSAQEVPSLQPVELILTAASSDESAGAPDLSVLERDFQILDRRVERRASVTNGKRREEVRLRLVLLPRRVGNLELPGIAFGEIRSQPLRLTVKGEGSGAFAEVPKIPASPLLDPGRFEPRGPLTPDSFDRDYYPTDYYPPGFYGDWDTTPWPSPAPAPGTLDSPALRPQDSASGQTSLGSALANPPAAPTETSAGTLRNPWFWISIALAALLAGIFRRRRGASSPRPAGTAHETPGLDSAPPDPLETAVETVRAAYRRADGGGAREALLNWGRLRWPQDPPGNLARLARRCPPPLRDHITELEKAFFSPEPIHWERDPVPEELMAQSPRRDHETAVV